MRVAPVRVDQHARNADERRPKQRNAPVSVAHRLGHLPLNPAELDGADAVIFVADTDGNRHQYW